ncbi:HU family DNA-binding protein [Deinococcus aestuarii]|uniref:HU family DNA-binding protein n=1 Tax=Deinococcus aestuarii TaxID=2774531 RepID=UPI001C0C2CC1|nr:HU family DNA-binding protein [Deinococcus aestuarii]
MTKKSTKAPARKPAATRAPKQDAAEAEQSAPAPEATGGRGGGKVAKTQLVEQVADQAGLTRKQADQAVNAVMEVIVEAIRSGKSVGLPGLGTLSVRATAARTGVRPGTSERIQIPAGRKVAFKVANPLKGALAGEGDSVAR